MCTNTAAHAHRPWTAQDRDHAQEALAKTRGTDVALDAMIELTLNCLLRCDDRLRRGEQSYLEHLARASAPF